MKTGIFPEYLGDVSVEDLLQNITNYNPHCSSLGLLHEYAQGGFSVSIEFERPYAENESDMKQLGREAGERFKPDDPTTWNPKPTRLVRIVLEANERANATEEASAITPSAASNASAVVAPARSPESPALTALRAKAALLWPSHRRAGEK